MTVNSRTHCCVVYSWAFTVNTVTGLLCSRFEYKFVHTFNEQLTAANDPFVLVSLSTPDIYFMVLAGLSLKYKTQRSSSYSPFICRIGCL